MSIKPLWPFYGSKWRDARRYPSPASGVVVEPFAGSAGYSTYFCPPRVHLIDADPYVVGVWEYLISVSERELLALPDLEPGQSVDDLILPQEAKWFIGFWLNRGSAQPKKTQTAFSRRTERQQLVWSERARARVASQVYAVRDWRVSLGDYRDAPMIAGATYFVDPPYVDKGRYYRINHVDHAALGAWCRDLPGLAIVCEQAGAGWLSFEPLATIKSTRGTSSEAIWTNEPPT